MQVSALARAAAVTGQRRYGVIGRLGGHLGWATKPNRTTETRGESDAAAFVSTLDGVRWARPTGKLAPWHLFPQRRPIERPQLLGEHSLPGFPQRLLVMLFGDLPAMTAMRENILKGVWPLIVVI
jgi:hypothetical protein